jgi:ribosomal protein S18 acetylase RimI-like enzyme
MIIHAEKPWEIEETRKLFRDYEYWFGVDLSFQRYDEEVAALPGKYAKPDGRLLLALSDRTAAAGCIALKKLEAGVCEMKRFFVREEFRGLGAGRGLIEKLLEEARLIGYQKMVLDTVLPKMQRAVRLYESYGFREIPPYYNNPIRGVLYMEKQL